MLLCFETIPKRKIASSGLSYQELLDAYSLNFDSVYSAKRWNRQNRQTKDILDGNRAMALTHSLSTFDGKKAFTYNIYQGGTVRWDKPYNLYTASREELDRLRQVLDNRLGAQRYTHVVLMSTGWNNQQDKSLFHYNNWLTSIQAAAQEKGENFRPLYVAITWPSFVRRPLLVPVFEKVEYTLGDFYLAQNNADELGMTHVNYLLWEVLVRLSEEHAVPLVLMGHSFGSRLLARASHSATYRGLPADSTNGEIDYFLNFQGAYRLSRHTGCGRGADDSIFAVANPWKQHIFTTSVHDGSIKSGRLMTGLFMGHPSVVQKVAEKQHYVFYRPDATGALPASTATEANIVLDCSAIINHHQDVTNPANGRLVWHFIHSSKP